MRVVYLSSSKSIQISASNTFIQKTVLPGKNTVDYGVNDKKKYGVITVHPDMK